MAQSLKKKKQNCISIGKQSLNTVSRQFNSVNCVDELPQLWNIYNSLPDSVEKDYVWDEIFITLSSLLEVVLKNTPENKNYPTEAVVNYTVN